MGRLIFLLIVGGVIAYQVKYKEFGEYWWDAMVYDIKAPLRWISEDDEEVAATPYAEQAEEVPAAEAPAEASVAEAAAAATPAAASTSELYVDVTNQTGYTVTALFVSPSNADNWGTNLLSEPLATGQAVRVSNLSSLYPNYSDTAFDVRLVDSDGDSYSFSKVDITTSDITATAQNIDRR